MIVKEMGIVRPVPSRRNPKHLTGSWIKLGQILSIRAVTVTNNSEIFVVNN